MKYPNAPMFYQLCDEFGFYVIDEADNESHVTSVTYLADCSTANQYRRWNETISDNPDFIESTLERPRRLVSRDRNRPCVLIWSMGNERAYGCTFEEALKWTKETDPTRLPHYESANYRSDKRKYDYSNTELYSRMYPAFHEIDAYLDRNPDKPMILCEYCHVMMDGLIYPDRKPHTGLMEFKNMNRPVRLAGFDQGSCTVQLRNMLAFSVSAKGRCYLKLTCEARCESALVPAGDPLGFDEAPVQNEDARSQASLTFCRDGGEALLLRRTIRRSASAARAFSIPSAN